MEADENINLFMKRLAFLKKVVQLEEDPFPSTRAVSAKTAIRTRESRSVIAPRSQNTFLTQANRTAISPQSKKLT